MDLIPEFSEVFITNFMDLKVSVLSFFDLVKLNVTVISVQTKGGCEQGVSVLCFPFSFDYYLFL